MTDRRRYDRELAERMLSVEVVRSSPSVSVVRPDGEIDMLTAPLLAERVGAEFASGYDVVLDLGGIDFLGSHGVATMFDLDGRATGYGRALHLAGTPSPGIARVLQLTGLAQVKPVTPDPADAVRALGLARGA